tara:strand:- start:230 stop:1000 length:771 start_codon:yes stop_codon:yes gene_type:complete
MKRKNINQICYKKITLYSITLMFFFSLFLIAYQWSHICGNHRLKHIIVSNTKVLDENIYRKVIGDIGEIKTNQINLKKIITSLEKHPYIEVVRASYRYPGTLKVEIVEREPIAILNSKPLLFLDKNGYVLPKIETSNHFSLPIMSNYNNSKELYPIGQKVLSVKTKESIEWLNQIRTQYQFLYNNLSEIRLVAGDDVELILLDEPTKILVGHKRFWDKIAILKEFRNNLNPQKNLTDFSYLDMRYKNQIIGRLRKS